MDADMDLSYQPARDPDLVRAQTVGSPLRWAVGLGVPDETWGEQVAAFVVLAPGAPSDESVLSDHVRAHLAPHKTPKVWRFVDGLPLTGSGKIQKFVLRDSYSAEP
jgi:fatty-acyl-CoA synthase